MKTSIVIIGWSLLAVFCWPLAILALVLWPLLWILSLPLRAVGIVVDAVFALLRTLLFLPARLFGFRDRPAGRAS